MISAYDEIYLEQARRTLGNMLDTGVYALGWNLRDFWDRFLVSSVSKRFARGDSSMLAGKSGTELACMVVEFEERVDIAACDDKSPEYWAGWALAYYQWSRNLTFDYIDKKVPIEDVVGLYFPYHEMDIRQFCDRMDELVFSGETRLQERRKHLNLTQRELALITGIPLRTIQQYEQRQKNINGARAEYIVALAKALYCSPEELLEVSR